MPIGKTTVQLNAAQQKAVTHGDGPLLIVAGAGTGKTTVITQRILWLMQHEKVKPEEILALTFTEKATEEMVTRVDQLLPYGYTELWISTFHGFCQRILEAHGIDIGLPNDFRLLNAVDAWVLVRKNLDRFNLDYYRPLGNPSKFIRALLQHFSRCKDEAITPETYLEYAKGLKLDADNAEGADNAERARIEEVANAYHTYQQLLLENNAFDFGDLLLYALRLFRERPKILAQYRQRFKYILVDEFQDTNWAQYEIVKLLAAPANNLTVVGDDDQAIYRWRGASMSNVLQFKETYPNATEIVLTENYRSRQNILDVSYNFIQQNNPNRLEIRLQTPKKLSTQQKGEGIIEYIQANTELDEAKQIAEKILALHSQSQRSDLHNREVRPLVSWSDIAVLVRANHQAEPIVRACDRHGIPYQFLASRGLYAKPLILDCIAYLRLCDNYHESAALYRVLVSPVVAMDDRDVVVLMQHAGQKNKSLYTVVEQAATLPITKESLAKLQKVMEWIRRHTALARTKTASEVLYSFLQDSGYLQELTKQLQHAGTVSLRTQEQVHYLTQLFKGLATFEQAESTPSVKQFLATLAVREEAGDEGALSSDPENGADVVKIMTVHGAKGLEFRYVFIPQLVELRFPSMDRKEPIDIPDALVKEIIPEGNAHLEEERRLFYVAMTRARDGLFFTSAEDYGGAKKKRPSRFLFEAGMIKEAKNQEIKKSRNQDLLPQYHGAQSSEILTTRLPIPERFSYTQLKAFETCPLQYKFAHILKIPVRGRFTFSFGKSMHATLQKFFERIMESQKSEQQDLFHTKTQNLPRAESRGLQSKVIAPSLDELLKIYDECWIDDWYESKEHEKEYATRGTEMLKGLYALHAKDGWPQPLALEQPFTVKMGNATLKGVIDRIDRITHNGAKGVAIVDYKTGNVPKNERDVAREQLYLYQMAVEEVMHEQPLQLTYYYLNEQKSFSFLGTPEEIAAMREKVFATITAIGQSDFAATPSPQKCNHCDFKEICEYRKL